MITLRLPFQQLWNVWHHLINTCVCKCWVFMTLECHIDLYWLNYVENLWLASGIRTCILVESSVGLIQWKRNKSLGISWCRYLIFQIKELSSYSSVIVDVDHAQCWGRHTIVCVLFVVMSTFVDWQKILALHIICAHYLSPVYNFCQLIFLSRPKYLLWYC